MRGRGGRRQGGGKEEDAEAGRRGSERATPGHPLVPERALRLAPKGQGAAGEFKGGSGRDRGPRWPTEACQAHPDSRAGPLSEQKRATDRTHVTHVAVWPILLPPSQETKRKETSRAPLLLDRAKLPCRTVLSGGEGGSARRGRTALEERPVAEEERKYLTRRRRQRRQRRRRQGRRTTVVPPGGNFSPRIRF